MYKRKAQQQLREINAKRARLASEMSLLQKKMAAAKSFSPRSSEMFKSPSDSVMMAMDLDYQPVNEQGGAIGGTHEPPSYIKRVFMGPGIKQHQYVMNAAAQDMLAMVERFGLNKYKTKEKRKYVVYKRPVLKIKKKPVKRRRKGRSNVTVKKTRKRKVIRKKRK